MRQEPGESVLSFGAPGTPLTEVCRRLSSVPAAAGHEDLLTTAVADHLRSRGLEVWADRLGQLAVEFRTTSKPNGHTVMLTCHLDELGLIVRDIDTSGFVRVHRLGGMPERVLPGLRMVIHTRNGAVPAIVGLQAHHLTPPEDKCIAKPATALYLDTGAANRAECEGLGVRIGDPVTYAACWDDLAGGRFAAKSLDDRIGVAAVLAAVDHLCANPGSGRVIVGFTTQEEFHIRGTLALVAKYQPDIVVNVDIAPASDTPDLTGVGAVRLGAGPVLSRLTFHGRGTLGGLLPHPALVHAVEQAADRAGIHLQFDAVVGVITDAAFVTMASAEGIAAVGIGIPVRYTHSPVETAQASDLHDTAALLRELIGDLGGSDLRRGVR